MIIIKKCITYYESLKNLADEVICDTINLTKEELTACILRNVI